MAGQTRKKEPEVTSASTSTPQERADKRVKNYTDLMWHIATFVIVNAFLLAIDLMQGGADWAYWVTLGWGIGLAFHVAAYLLDRSGGQSRRYQRYLEEEENRQSEGSADV